MILKHRIAVALPLAVAFSACLTGAAAPEEPAQTLSRSTEIEAAKASRVIFVCPKDTLLTVEFVTADPTKAAVVQTPDGSQLSLPAQESGSGYRYADETHELRGKGREVTWKDGAKPPVVCTEETAAEGGNDAERPPKP